MILSEKASAFFIENLISKSTDNKKAKQPNGSPNAKLLATSHTNKQCRNSDGSAESTSLNYFSCSSSSSTSSFSSSVSQHNSPYASSSSHHSNPKYNSNKSPTNHDCVSPVSSKVCRLVKRNLFHF